MRKLLLSCLLCTAFLAQAQEEPYALELEEVTVSGFEGLHSGVGIKWREYWIFIGGRTNGLHGFRPPLAFPIKDEHGKIVVVDVEQDLRWEQSMENWPDQLREPLSCSNMQYALKDDLLLICGGYGWQKSFDDFTTFPSLCAVDVADLVQRVQAEESAESLFTQIEDETFAVCGGNMAFMGDTCSIVFGHKFVGHYSRNENGFFEQSYTNEVRRFSIKEGEGFDVNILPALKDTNHFHRRDYNLVAQVDPKGNLHYTAFSGVFRYDANLPYYHPVEVYRDGKTDATHTFEQKFSHYHSAVLPVYDPSRKAMHNYFFGGMAEYYLDSATGNTVHDTLVPFVKTISRVTKDEKGYSESVLDTRMPLYVGTNMWFLPAEGVGYYQGKVLNGSYIEGKTLVGYLVGGITSPFNNISMIDPSISVANKRIYKVYLSDRPLLTTLRTSEGLGLDVFPNPSQGQFFMSVDPGNAKDFNLELLDSRGRVIKTWTGNGKKNIVWSPGELSKGTYFARLRSNGAVTEKRLIWE